MAKEELPAVFHMKPLNNWPNETKIMNNVCRCQCHTSAQKESSDWWQDFKSTMIIKVKKKRVLMAIIGLCCFIFGLAIPLLFIGTSTLDLPSTERPSFAASLVHFRKHEATKPHDDFDSAVNITLDNVFISVKTTKQYHYPRVIIQLETWASLVKSQTWFFTDTHDAHLMERTNGHLIATNCSESHSRVALACKMGVEFDTFLKSHKPWWCHFDDDNYVHVSRLSQLLQSYSPDRPVYIGKTSTAHPLEIWDLNSPQNVSHFWFATGGAGFCISRTLALKMAPFTANGKLVRTGEEFWFPDDVTIGYIIEHILKEKLIVNPHFHSHLEPMKNVGDLEQQITLSYNQENVIGLDGPLTFSKEVDPTRFYSLHCHLYGGPFCRS